MTLIAILLALLVEHFASHYRDAGLYETRGGPLTWLRRRLPSRRLWNFPLWPALLVLLPTVLVSLLRHCIDNSLLQLPYDALILFLCLGPRDLADDIHRLIAAREAGDDATVQRLTLALKRGPMPDTDARNLLGALFIQSHERLFGTLIWFIFGGPAGAVLYRLASRLPRVFLSSDGDGSGFSRRFHAAAAWLPARITGALYGIVGSADDALAAWRNLPAGQSWVQRTWTLLAEVPSAALNMEIHGAKLVPARLETALEEVLRMQRRALLVLLAIFALYTAGAWLA